MNSEPHVNDGDQVLRTALRASLHKTGTTVQHADIVDATAELQQRVLTQWWQRHTVLDGASMPRLSNGRVALLGHSRRQRQLIAGLLVALALAATAWCLRPDPLLSELMQPDVLSELGLGEL